VVTEIHLRGTTHDLIKHIPLIQPQMVALQAYMNKMIPSYEEDAGIEDL
jgi:hypothetical protein